MTVPKQSSLADLLADQELMLAVVQRAMRTAVLSHARAGHPVATWRDGKVVWIAPQEILADPLINPQESNQG